MRTIDHEIIMKGIGPIAEINCTIETGTTPENIKKDKSWHDYERDRFYIRDRSYDRNDSYSRDRAYVRNKSYHTDRSCSRDRSQDYYESNYRDDYRNDYRNENQRDQRHKRRHGDYHENKCEDGYISDYDDSSGDRYDKGKHNISYKNRGRSKNKYQDRYRDDSCDQITGRSKEKDYLCDDDDIFHSKNERVHNILQTMSQEKEMAIGFILIFFENPDKILDNIYSLADVDQLIAERIEYAKSQKAAVLAKDPHVNASSTASLNYESINVNLDLTQGSVDSEFIEQTNSDSEEGIQFF